MQVVTEAGFDQPMYDAGNFGEETTGVAQFYFKQYLTREAWR